MLPAAAELQRTGSFGGVVPVALTNANATADEATHGPPVTGPGIAEPFPSDAHDAALPSPSAVIDSGEHAVQVSVAMVVLHVCAYMCVHTCLLWQLVRTRLHAGLLVQLH